MKKMEMIKSELKQLSYDIAKAVNFDTRKSGASWSITQFRERLEYDDASYGVNFAFDTRTEHYDYVRKVIARFDKRNNTNYKVVFENIVKEI